MDKIGTNENPTDMLTKALVSTKFKHCQELLHLVEGKYSQGGELLGDG